MSKPRALAYSCCATEELDDIQWLGWFWQRRAVKPCKHHKKHEDLPGLPNHGSNILLKTMKHWNMNIQMAHNGALGALSLKSFRTRLSRWASVGTPCVPGMANNFRVRLNPTTSKDQIQHTAHRSLLASEHVRTPNLEHPSSMQTTTSINSFMD